MWCCLARSMNMSFPRRRRVWGIKSQAVKQRKILKERRKEGLRSRRERIANEILMYFRTLKKSAGDLSLSEAIDSDKDGNTLSLYDVLCSEDTILSQVLLEMNVKRLYELLDEVLDARERHILRLRYGLGGQKEYTQREVAQGLGISRSYVSRRR